MKKLILLFVFLCSAHSVMAQTTEVEFEEYEINLNIAALEARQYFSTINKYKVAIELVGKDGLALIGPLKGSTSANIYKYFQNELSVKVGESADLKARVLLPIKTLEMAKVRITVLGANFRIVLPGGPLIVNNDDRVAAEAFAIEETQAEVNQLLDHTSAMLTITKLDNGYKTVEEIVADQREIFLLGGGLFLKPNDHLQMIQRFILRTLN